MRMARSMFSSATAFSGYPECTCERRACSTASRNSPHWMRPPFQERRIAHETAARQVVHHHEARQAALQFIALHAGIGGGHVVPHAEQQAGIDIGLNVGIYRRQCVGERLEHIELGRQLEQDGDGALIVLHGGLGQCGDAIGGRLW